MTEEEEAQLERDVSLDLAFLIAYQSEWQPRYATPGGRGGVIERPLTLLARIDS